MTPIAMLTVFVLAVFVGFEIISKVSSRLHTPLMSGANAIHGVILVGAILLTARTTDSGLVAVGVIATVLAAVNLVGGFVVTDRMLQLFRSRRPTRPETSAADASRTVAPRTDQEETR
ncbi:MAG: NAD(P) transhydrogenase subunit alpha [Mycobacteriales bacterium]